MFHKIRGLTVGIEFAGQPKKYTGFIIPSYYQPSPQPSYQPPFLAHQQFQPPVRLSHPVVAATVVCEHVTELPSQRPTRLRVHGHSGHRGIANHLRAGPHPGSTITRHAGATGTRPLLMPHHWSPWVAFGHPRLGGLASCVAWPGSGGSWARSTRATSSHPGWAGTPPDRAALIMLDLSEITMRPSWGVTCLRRFDRKKDHASVVSDSTSAKAIGKILSFPSWATAISKTPPYFPYKWVPSMEMKFLQCLNASMHGGNDQKALSNCRDPWSSRSRRNTAPFQGRTPCPVGTSETPTVAAVPCYTPPPTARTE
ncbi:hypothetical protein PIB30_075335 [Stylosanthes scabra]|uniref:Uncharacterized protein n=1 Tax=Stylosanthes scabra TaxID=79078 RepID=A0ABU6TPI6_9FABA|nr:hypothetical protein [Stylosanthes scabra]